ncbi:DNA mismatch repair protein Msh3 [Merluccius polli]|uniref:DNA mismatch repair protein MSH3 n=1 Tax=Merluccius polli TaxID=89951 RepID=A0AA47MBQ2_MERPO|nr:DNA mismatch repair protein Msh3 [Merluccius polli]
MVMFSKPQDSSQEQWMDQSPAVQRLQDHNVDQMEEEMGVQQTSGHGAENQQQQQRPAGEAASGPPVKRGRLSSQAPGQQGGDEATETPRVRGGRGLSAFTVERLQSFCCTAEPSRGSVGEVEEEEQKKEPGNGVSKICDQGKDAMPPCGLRDQHNNTKKPKQETEEEDEEEEAVREESSVMSPKTQRMTLHQFAKTGGGRVPGSSPPQQDASAPCRRSKSAFTPLEQQVVQLKQQHEDTLLAVECGYKYRFFGEDAEIAAKELNIFCHLDHNFMTCSIPTHRLFVHVRRLVSQGHKVGVVKQMETSAIKASGANKNALFTRQLSALYTKSTLVGEDVNPLCSLGEAEDDRGSDPPDSYLLCISENWDKLGKQLTIGLVAVQPSTGDVLLDSFTDGHSRSELEARILKVNPVEILVPSDLSEHTHRLLQSIATASTQAEDRVQIQRKDAAQFEFPSAMNTVTEFYCHSQDTGSRSLASVAALEMQVICCLGPLIQYLREFNLERVLLNDSSFRCLSTEAQGLVLSATTLRNLEILRNQTDGGLRGSLLWVLDHTSTVFGRRLLRRWVSQPLTDLRSISDRQDAVCEILQSDSAALASIRSLLAHLPDLERGICSIYHTKCSSQEFYLISSSLSRLGLELQALIPAIQSQLSSSLLRTLLLDTPELLSPVHHFLKVLNEKAAKSGDKKELFSDLSDFPALRERRAQIQSVLDEVRDHRKDVRVALRVPALDYTTVSGLEFLIEVKNSMSAIVPHDWVKISSTKAVGRYHSPFLVKSCHRLQQLREQLQLDCQRAWIDFLHQFGEHYHTMKRAVGHLATMDCLFSLAAVAKQGDYCRPEMVENRCQIVIRDGRNPAIDLLMGEHSQYVPNHTDLQGEGRRTMIVTGPNMGGKSSYIRQVALVCVMAQMGGYVPATQASLGILDGIYTRMGASDNITRGGVLHGGAEEASEIIAQATERSMVIMDELGRGTSTRRDRHAYATLEHFIRE